jgi:ArsR family transcriptional regulator
LKLIQIYQCLCDKTRLRILNLLISGPLCVCHFQKALREGQVKISKHLAYLRKRELVETRRDGYWMIYRLPKVRPPELDANLRCLHDCVREDPVFRLDLARLQRRRAEFDAMAPCKHSSNPCKSKSHSKP